MKKILIAFVLIYLLMFVYAISTIAIKKIPHFELHKGSKTHIVAHRGYSSLAKENSIKSLSIANNSDCVDLLEIDVRLTKDGVLVLSHDNNILKIGKKKFNISSNTYDQIKNIKLIDEYNLPLNAETLERKTIVLPTLKEALKTINKTVIIDIKYNKNIKELNNSLLALIDEYDNVILQSTNVDGLNDLYKKNNLMKYQFIIDSAQDYYNIPDYIYGVSVKHSILKEKEIKKIMDSGIKLFVWTINDIKTYQNVQSILKSYSSRAYYISDYPEILCTYDTQIFLEV